MILDNSSASVRLLKHVQDNHNTSKLYSTLESMLGILLLVVVKPRHPVIRWNIECKENFRHVGPTHILQQKVLGDLYTPRPLRYYLPRIQSGGNMGLIYKKTILRKYIHVRRKSALGNDNIVNQPSCILNI